MSYKLAPLVLEPLILQEPHFGEGIDEEMRICFMCDEPASTDDHIPPKCIFPEQKDVGVDYRKNLITVPACDNHNLKTSLDDEYLMGVLAFHWRNNKAAYKQSTTKIKRAFQRNKRYYNLFFGASKHQLLFWNGEQLITAPVDIDRFSFIMQKIARGIYYHHFNRKWLGDISIRPISLVAIYDRDPGPIITPLIQITQQMKLLCSKQPLNGANPDIFYYQVAHNNPPTHTIMRLVFYGGFEVIANLSDNPCGNS